MFEVSEKPRRVERAFLVSVVRHKEDEPRAFSLLEELKELVEQYGDIFDLKIRWRMTRWYAFVKYYRRTDAENAVRELHGSLLDDRQLTVALAATSVCD